MGLLLASFALITFSLSVSITYQIKNNDVRPTLYRNGSKQLQGGPAPCIDLGFPATITVNIEPTNTSKMGDRPVTGADGRISL